MKNNGRIILSPQNTTQAGAILRLSLVIKNIFYNFLKKALDKFNFICYNNIMKWGNPLFYKGFTLIELLVVVLIIGILAAVALPQYQMAVNKTKFAKLRSLGLSFAKETELFYTLHGTSPKIEDLNIDFPAGWTPISLGKSTCAQSSEMYCCINQRDPGNQALSVTCGVADYSFNWLYRFASYQFGEFCAAKNDNANALKLCQMLGTYSEGMNMVTPTGHHTGYKNYKLSDSYYGTLKL